MTLRFKTITLAIAFTALMLNTGFAQMNVQPTGSQTQIGSAVQGKVVHSPTMHLTDGLIPSQSTHATFSDLVPVPASVDAAIIYPPAPIIQECDCNHESCSRCRLRRPLKCGCKKRGCRGECVQEAQVQCPSCDGDVCKLTTKKEKQKKTAFKTKQEQICVPAVRLPWQKNCPPSVSKTRLVNRLQRYTYECEVCKYKWSVVETNNCGDQPAAAEAPTDAQKPEAEEAETSKPKVKFDEADVPEAPKVKGAFLRPWRSR
jgi:hypothetical protein